MGNEASQEGGGQPGEAAPTPTRTGAAASGSAPPGSGQQGKPSNGAPAGVRAAGGGPGVKSVPAKKPQPSGGDGGAGAGRQALDKQPPAEKKGAPPTQADKGGMTPSAPNGGGSSPALPYTVPQIAPMPSSNLCPVCKTADLKADSSNTCTQCRQVVCGQCGFNPNPHLTEVQEWLCLNCQMQRALGMDMTTPQSKQPGGLAKAPSQPDLSRSSTNQSGQQDHTRSAGSSPSRQSQEQPLDKLFGFGASILSQASTLMSVDPLLPSQPPPAPTKTHQGPVSGPASGPATAPGLHAPPQQQPAQRPKELGKLEPNCPLCKAELNVSKFSEPPNYSTCTQCHTRVCNMCGFNPTPHLVEKKEWLCLNCQTQRLMSGGLGDAPLPVPQPSPQQPQAPANQQQASHQKETCQQSEPKPTSQESVQKPSGTESSGQSDKLKKEPEIQPSPAKPDTSTGTTDGKKEEEAQSLKNDNETKSSTQSLSDTGYSSDGVSSSQSEITGLIQEDANKPPNASEITKPETSTHHCEAKEGDDKKQRPCSLSFGNEGHKEQLDGIGEEDYKKPHKDTTDEEFMRSKTAEMSVDREDREDNMMTSQGGLRRFKTIELNNTNSYNRDIQLRNNREPELEMENLTGSPDERSKGEYSSTLSATTSSYTSAISPTSVSSMEEDSDSSPSRKQRLEDAKQQRKARHRSHGPLLPTIEDSSEEDELREEEELLREQEMMREVEERGIRSTARKTKRDKEELRAQRRRERSKTPPSNLSPIEDASPTEELRQAAEMEELHRSSCSEYSPSIDSEAEGFEMMTSKSRKTANEHNLPTFMSLYSPTEKLTTTSPCSGDKTLKSAEEAYEEMIRKAEMLQKSQGEQLLNNSKEIEKQLLDARLTAAKLVEQNRAPLTPGTSPTQISAPISLADVHVPSQIANRSISRQQSLQESGSPSKLMTINSSTSPLSSPTRLSRQSTIHSYTPESSSPTSTQRRSLYQSPQHSFPKDRRPNSAGTMEEEMENKSLCRLSTVPGTSMVVQQGKIQQSSSIVDLRAPIKPAPLIMTEQGMDLTSVATEIRRYSIGSEVSYSRHSTAVQPLIMNLNTHEHPRVAASTPTTVNVTVAASKFISQPKIPVIYGDPLQNKVDLGQGLGSAVCLTQSKVAPNYASIPKIDACLEDLGIQQQQLQLQQEKLQKQKEKLEQQLQAASFARYNLANQAQPMLLKKDLQVCQTSNPQAPVSMCAISRTSSLPSQTVSSTSHDIYCGIPLELKSKPTAVNLTMAKSHAMMVQLVDSTSQGKTVTQIVKASELPTQEVLDLTGQIKAETQLACCDVVYNLPFGGSSKGPFSPKVMLEEKMSATDASQSSYSALGPEVSGNLQAVPRHESHQYQEHASVNQNVNEDNKSQPASISGQPVSVSGPPVSVCEQPELVSGPPVSVSGQSGSEPPGSVSGQPGSVCAQPSLSNTDFVDAGLQGDQSKANPGTDLNTIQRGYVGGYLGVGAQYGSYTDLRQQNDIGQSFPMRRYGSMSSINTDYGYSTIPESSLAQYSATTAREISRMCAALNSMEQVGGRYGNNPEVFQYGSVAGGSPLGRPSLQQGLTSVRASLIYGHNGGHPAQGQVYANLINSNQASLRYPSAVRSADGMIYSTINTPIPSTLPITTQPASVLCPPLQGIYRPYTPGNLTSVPLASLTRLPQVTPRMPLSAQGPYRYPPPSRFPSGPCAAANATPQIPIYLGKPSIKPTVPSTMQTAESLPPAQSSQQVTHPASIMVSTQQQSQSHFTMQIAPKIPVQPQTQTQSQIQMQPQTHQNIPRAAQATTIKTSNPEKEKEEEQLRQKQEQLLQLERERVGLEKLRHLRLQEELERDRMELQRHREKEQLLVQREIQELQSIKQQVLQQQHAERETQLVLQREQLAQQKVQLDQIQSLQQQLQQHLEEQKRQKTAETTTSAQGFSVICPITGRVIQKDLTQPYADGQGLIISRPLPSSTSEMSLKNNEELLESQAIKKLNSMPRLRDSAEGEDNQLLVKRITDSCVQTDDEEGEERSIISRRRRTRHIVDSSVQTDEEDQDEWEQPVRRRRSRFSKHSSLESSLENKVDTSKVSSLNVAIQTINDSSCQTELELLRGISPSIHITSEPKVEFLHYISAPERNWRGESLACQTEPESQSQGVVVPQVNVSSTADPLSLRITGASKFERRKPDPLEIGFQNEPVSSLVRQPPKSPQVLYSPVSPLSPHRLLENSFSSSERLNKAHVPPQKHFSVDSPEHHQTLPHPIKSMQRSLSDPKPISPTSEDPAQAKFSIYQHQALLNKQQSMPTRKVKRTLPSPPPEERSLPIVTPTHNSMFASTNKVQPALSAPKPALLSDLRVVEQESSKLRKQQAELEEEEKEIDAKLRCLELGITQRKETLIKERERRELAYVRCMGESRDYTTDSELTAHHLRGTPFDSSGSLTRLSAASLNQFTANQLTPGSSFLSYDYQQSQPGPPPQDSSAYQQIGFQPPQYQTVSLGQPQPGTFQPQSSAAVLHQSHIFPQNQAPYQTSLVLQQSHTGFQPPPSSASYVSQTLPYSEETGQGVSLQPQPKTQHQKPRQTSLADLEQKMPTNYEVISTPPVAVAPTALVDMYNSAYSSTTISNTYGQYRPPEQSLSAEIHSAVNPTPAYSSEGHYTNLEQNIPRNYVMIDDINELTKESRDTYRTDRNGGYGNVSHYGRAGGNSEDLYDHQCRIRGDYNSHVDGSSYYYDDYRSSSCTHSKNMAPAVMSSKRNKHRKPGMEQISKFSPIEEARDVESDLASYNTSNGGSTTSSRARRLQGDITYGLKKNAYEQQKYYGMSSRDGLEEDNRVFSSGRSRSTGYGMDKIASREYGSYRSKSYEMNIEERSHRGSRRRSQNLDESPMNDARGPTGSESRDTYNQYGSSHSLPDVQDRTTDLPRSHIYKQDDPYLVDDMNCAVSDSEAYHLGQEETDWFEKPRESRSERSRHHSGSSSTHRRRHSQHEYDEPLEKEPLPQDDYAQPRSSSSASQEHGQQGSSSRRHSTSSRHSCDDLRTSRSSREHTNDPTVHPESRGSPSTAKRRTSDSRSTQDHPSDQSQDPSSHHQGSPGPRKQKQSSSPSTRRHEMQRMASTESKSQSSSPKHRASSGQQPSSQQQEGQQGHGQQKPQSRRGSGAGAEAGAEAQAEAGAGAGTAQHQQSTPSQPPAQALAQVPAQAPTLAQAQTETPAPVQAPVQAPASAQAPDLAPAPAPAEAEAPAQAQAQVQAPESDRTPASAPAPAPAQAPSQAQQPHSSPKRTPVAPELHQMPRGQPVLLLLDNQPLKATMSFPKSCQEVQLNKPANWVMPCQLLARNSLLSGDLRKGLVRENDARLRTRKTYDPTFTAPPSKKDRRGQRLPSSEPRTTGSRTWTSSGLPDVHTAGYTLCKLPLCSGTWTVYSLCNLKDRESENVRAESSLQCLSAELVY